MDAAIVRKAEQPALDLAGDEAVAMVRRLVELNGLDA